MTSWAVRLLVVASLVVDGYVHATLAPERWGDGHLFTQGQLFAAEAAAAGLAGLALLLTARQAVWAAAALVALGGMGAVVLYTYVDVPAIGPVPSMYEPIWYGEKTLSAVAEGFGGVLALAQLGTLRRRR